MSKKAVPGHLNKKESEQTSSLDALQSFSSRIGVMDRKGNISPKITIDNSRISYFLLSLFFHKFF